jgi:hypothetical protein
MLLYTKTRAEAWAEIHLRKEGLVTLLPRVRGRGGFAPLFPRYLLAGCTRELVGAVWPARIGVLYAVPHGDTPARIAPELIARLRDRTDARGIVTLDAVPDPDSLFTPSRRDRVRALLRLAGALPAAA